MKVDIIYPDVRKIPLWKRDRSSILRSAFVFTGYACLIINLLTGDFPWCLIVIGGLITFWVIFIYRPMVESTLIKKMSDSGIVVCLYLFMLDGLLGGGWSDFVVPIVFFGDLIVIGSYYLMFFKKQKRNFMPLFELVLTGLIALLCGLVGLRDLNWPLIVVGCVSGALIALSLILFKTPMLREFGKKFHI